MAAKMQSSLPARKVWVAGVAGAITTVLIWILNTFALPDDSQISGEIGAALLTVVAFLLSYFIPPAKDDQIVSA